MPLVSTRVVVLQVFPYSDTSKILRVLSEELGVCSLMAKGALRPKSRFGGLLEPFTDAQAQFFAREGRDLHTLSGFDLLRSRQSLGRDLTAFAGASLIAELVLRFATEEPNSAIFQSLCHSLDRLASQPEDARAAALAGVWQMVALLGYEPELAHCVRCGRPIPEEEPTRFDMDAGGTACMACRPQGRTVDPETRRSLSAMLNAQTTHATGDWSLHRALLRSFLATHLSAEHPLRSLELFVDQLR